MTLWLRGLHKGLALLLGLQMLAWACSGFMMSWLDASRVQGREFLAPQQAAKRWPEQALPVDHLLAREVLPVRSVSAGWLLDKPVYRLGAAREERLVDALSGQSLVLDAAMAQRLALASYRGPGQASAARLVGPSLETRAHGGELWRIDFSDPEETSVYLSQQGELLWHRNRSWRLYDFFWMLHIMDYAGRKDFNHPLLIGVALGGCWLALSGLWLLLASFRRADLLPQRWRRLHLLGVHNEDGQQLASWPVVAGESVFEMLAERGMPLPSNCGGAQRCGLCEVRVRGAVPPPGAADRALVAAPRLASGHRLACSLRLAGPLDIELPGPLARLSAQEAEVESVRAVTPLLREIVLRVAPAAGGAGWPGAYLQIHVPAYEMAREQIEFPADHARDWAALALPPRWRNASPLRRAYSLASPVDSASGRLTLLARLCHQPLALQPPGLGSAYMYGLKAGDRLHFSGPFGDFALKPGGREKVFIGAGAGMAPLRAMVRSLIDSGANEPLHFWYGARSQRETPYGDEMAALALACPNFSWQLVLSRADAGGSILRGYVHEQVHAVLLSRQPALDRCEFYLCGPPAMLAATRAMLKALGVADALVAFDDFKL